MKEDQVKLFLKTWCKINVKYQFSRGTRTGIAMQSDNFFIGFILILCDSTVNKQLPAELHL